MARSGQNKAKAASVAAAVDETGKGVAPPRAALLPVLAARAADTRTFLVNAAVLAVLLLVVPVVAVQFLQDQVITFAPQRSLTLRTITSSALNPVEQPAHLGKTETRSPAQVG